MLFSSLLCWPSVRQQLRSTPGLLTMSFGPQSEMIFLTIHGKKKKKETLIIMSQQLWHICSVVIHHVYQTGEKRRVLQGCDGNESYSPRGKCICLLRLTVLHGSRSQSFFGVYLGIPSFLTNDTFFPFRRMTSLAQLHATATARYVCKPPVGYAPSNYVFDCLVAVSRSL